jgi:hypothetical protein
MEAWIRNLPMQLLYEIEVKIPSGCSLSLEQMCLLNEQLGMVDFGVKLWCDMSTLVAYCTDEAGLDKSHQDLGKRKIAEKILRDGGIFPAECEDISVLEDMLHNRWVVFEKEKVVFGKRFVVEEERMLMKHGYKKCPTCRLVKYQFPHECKELLAGHGQSSLYPAPAAP